MGKKSTRKRGGEPSDETGAPNDTKTEKDKCNATPGMEYVIDKKGNRHCIPKCPADHARKLERDGALDCLNKEQCEAQDRDFLTVKKKDFCLSKCPEGLVRDYGSTKCLTEEARADKKDQTAVNQKRGAQSRKKQPENAAEANSEEGKSTENAKADKFSPPYTEPSPGTRKRAKEKAKARFKSHFGSVHKDFNREIEYDGLTNDQREKKSQEGKHRENATANKISPPDGLTKEERARRRRATRIEKFRSSQMYETIVKERSAKQAALAEERSKADRELEEQCAKEGTSVIQLGNKKKVCTPICAEDEEVIIGLDRAVCRNEAKEKEAKQNKALEKKRLECAEKGLDAVTHNGKNICVPVCKTENGEKLNFTGNKPECLTQEQIEQREADERRKEEQHRAREDQIARKNLASALKQQQKEDELERKNKEEWLSIFQTKVNLDDSTTAKSSDAKEVKKQIDHIEAKIQALKNDADLLGRMSADKEGGFFKEHFFGGYNFNKNDKENLCLNRDRKLNANQLSVYTMSRLRAEDIVVGSGLLVNHGTGAGKTLIGVLIMLAFWNKLHGDKKNKFWCIMSISTKKNQQEDNDVKKLAQLIIDYFPFYEVYYKGKDGQLVKKQWFSKEVYLQQIDLTEEEYAKLTASENDHKFDKDKAPPQMLSEKYGEEAGRHWAKVCDFKDHWRWVKFMLGDRIFAGISDSLVPRVKDLDEDTQPQVRDRVEKFWNNREQGGILLFTNSYFGRDFEMNLWPSDADVINKQRVVKNRLRKPQNLDEKLVYLEQIVEGFLKDTTILDPTGPNYCIDHIIKKKIRDNEQALNEQEEKLNGRTLLEYNDDISKEYMAEGAKLISDYEKGRVKDPDLDLPETPENKHIDIAGTPLNTYLTDIIAQFQNLTGKQPTGIKFKRNDPIGFVFKQLNEHPPHFTIPGVIRNLIEYFIFKLKEFYSIEPVETKYESYKLYPENEDGRIDLKYTKTRMQPIKMVEIQRVRTPVYQVEVQEGAIDNAAEFTDKEVIQEADEAAGITTKEEDEGDNFLEAAAGITKEKITKKEKPVLSEDEKLRIVQIMQTPYFRLNQKRQMEHCVFILDEMQFLFAPPAKEMQYKPYYQRTLYALQHYRNTENTYVVGLTATPGFTTSDVRSIVSIIQGAPDEWIDGGKKKPSLDLDAKLQEMDVGLINPVFYFDRKPGVIQGKEFYDRPEMINGSPHYKVRNVKSDDVAALQTDIERSMVNYVSVADFSADKRYFPEVEFKIICVPLTPSYGDDIKGRKEDIEDKAKAVFDHSIEKNDKQMKAFRELYANRPIYLVAGEYYLNEEEAIRRAGGSPEFVTKVELPITEYKKTFRQDMLFIREATTSVDYEEEKPEPPGDASAESRSGSTDSESGSQPGAEPGTADPVALTVQPGAEPDQPPEPNGMRLRDRAKLKKDREVAQALRNRQYASDDSNNVPIYEPEFAYEPYKTSQSNGQPKLITPSTKLMAVIDQLLSGVASNNGKHYVYCSDSYALFVIAHYLRTISHRTISLEKVEGVAMGLTPSKEVVLKDKEIEILQEPDPNLDLVGAVDINPAEHASEGGAKGKGNATVKAKGKKDANGKTKKAKKRVPKAGRLNLVEFNIKPDDPANEADPYKYRHKYPKLLPYKGETVNELMNDFKPDSEEKVLRFFYMQGKTTALSPYEKSIPSALVDITKRGREIVSGMHTYENINKEAEIPFDGEYREDLKDQLVNLEGDLIPIILATGENYKGVDFKGIRHIHVVDPFVDINDLIQLMGRGPRTCSHALLEPKDRNVTLYIYMGNYTLDPDAPARPPKTVDWDIYHDSVRNFSRIWTPIYSALRSVSYDREVFRTLLDESLGRVEMLLSLRGVCDKKRDKLNKEGNLLRKWQIVKAEKKKLPKDPANEGKTKKSKPDTELTLKEVYDLKFQINAILFEFKQKNKAIPKLLENMYKSFNVVKDPATPSVAIVTVRWSDNTVSFPLKYLINNDNCRKIKKYFSALLLAVTYIQASDDEWIPRRTDAETKLAEQTAINIAKKHPVHKQTRKKAVVPDAAVADVAETKNENDGSSASSNDTVETETTNADVESENTEGEEDLEPEQRPEQRPEQPAAKVEKAKRVLQCPAKHYPLPSQKDFCNASEIDREVLTGDLERRYSDEANPNGKMKNKNCLEMAATKRKQLETLQKSCVKHYTKSKSRLCVEKPVEDLEGGGKRKRSRKCRSKPLTRKKRAKKAKAGWWFWK